MIRLDSVILRSGDFLLENLSFTVPTGSYTVLMGPTGCGKSTILEAICGLRAPEKGTIWLGDRESTTLPPRLRALGYVPQESVLFPRMKVWNQLAFALHIQKMTAQKIKQRVEELAENLGISHLLERMPDHLSGGERQRVALGRALASQPKVLLLDEPLSALDDATRDALIQLLQNLHRTFACTVLHVTHHQSEARALAQCSLRLEQGRITVG